MKKTAWALAAIGFAGSLMLAAAPAQAQDLNVDLDPFHIFTPAPEAPTAPAVVVHHHHHHHWHHHHWAKAHGHWTHHAHH